jgi:hypothetical protein
MASMRAYCSHRFTLCNCHITARNNNQHLTTCGPGPLTRQACHAILPQPYNTPRDAAGLQEKLVHKHRAPVNKQHTGEGGMHPHFSAGHHRTRHNRAASVRAAMEQRHHSACATTMHAPMLCASHSPGACYVQSAHSQMVASSTARKAHSTSQHNVEGREQQRMAKVSWHSCASSA